MNENVTPTGSIGERIKEVIHHYHLTMNSFLLRLKLPSNSVITRVVKDPRRGMSLDESKIPLLDISRHYGHTSISITNEYMKNKKAGVSTAIRDKYSTL